MPEIREPESVGELPNIEVNKWGDQFEAGRISMYVENWAKITSDSMILSHIRNFKLEFIEKPTQQWPMPEIKLCEQEKVCKTRAF